MKRLLIALTLSVFAGCAAAPSLPWKTTDELQADVSSARPMLCTGAISAPGTTVVMFANHQGKDYEIFIAETGKFVAAEFGLDDQPVQIYEGTMDVNGGKQIHVVRAHKFDPDKDGVGPCPLLFPPAVD